MSRYWFSPALAVAIVLLRVVGAHAQSPINITVTQVDDARFPQVDVFVSITDASGNPVRNVSPSALQLEENGKAVPLVAATRAGEQNPVNAVLVIDRSGSMHSAGKMEGAKQAAVIFVNQMRPGDRTAIVQFDTEIETLQPLTEDKTALVAAIQRIVPRGNTALYDAIAQAARHFESVQGRKAIIVLTDGMDNASKVSREAIITQASAGGFSTYTIGLGEKGAGYGSQAGIDEASLREISKASFGDYFYAPDASQLRGLYQELSLRIQNEYKLTYTSASPLRDGLKRSLRVTALGAAAQAAYNPGGVIPEVEAGWVSWLLFFIALVLLLALLGAPLLWRWARTRDLPVPAFQSKPRVKLGEVTSAAPPAGTRTAEAVTRPARIKIKSAPAASSQPKPTLPWDDHAAKH